MRAWSSETEEQPHKGAVFCVGFVGRDLFRRCTARLSARRIFAPPAREGYGISVLNSLTIFSKRGESNEV